MYAGEHFDTDMQQYYLRARWYDQQTGRFNRMDPFAGNNQDPQSLHKYLYCHANPVSYTDPSGKAPWTLTEKLLIGTFLAILTGYALLSLPKGPKPAKKTYQDDILTVRINPIIIFPAADSPMMFNEFEIGVQVAELETDLARASNYWRKKAGIDVQWGEIGQLNRPDLLVLDGEVAVDAAVSELYTGYPVLLAVDTIEEYTSGLTASHRKGFAMKHHSPAMVIAHELGHVFIGGFFPHFSGNRKNLMVEGVPSVPLEQCFLTQGQVNAARKRVTARGWVVNDE